MIVLTPKQKIFAFVGIFIIIIVIGFWSFQGLKTLVMPKIIIMPEKILENKKVVLIIAFRDFRDVEYFIPKDTLTNAGVKVVTVSTQKGTAIGADGGETEVDLTLDELNPANFDGIAFIGGPGALKYLDNEKSYEIAKKTVENNKVLGAICIAPTILAKARTLEGKKATVWSAPLQTEPIKILQENGAIYQDQDVVVDDKIVTANGPGAAKKFGEILIELLK